MRIIIASLFFILAGTALISLVREQNLVSAKKLYSAASNSFLDRELTSVDLAADIKNVSHGLLASVEGKKLAVNYLVSLASTTNDSAEKIQIYCKAFDLAGQLIEKEPYNSKALINWAYWQQILESSDCGVALTKQEREDFLARVIKTDPTNSEVLYSAALLHIWAEQRENALPIFHNVLRLSTKLDAGQADTIINSVTTPEEFEALIPARFPQVIRWTNLLKEKNQELYNLSVSNIENLQLNAVKNSLSDMNAGKIPIRLHLRNLIDLNQSVVNENVRKELDKSLAVTLGERTSLGKYFLERSQLQRLNINRAFIEIDSQPARNSFSLWNQNKLVYLDAVQSSIGFFKSGDTRLTNIELVSASNSASIAKDALQLFASNDNAHWQEIKFEYRQIANPNYSGSFILIEPKSSDFNYFKINYKLTNRTKSFGNQANLIVNTYARD